MGRAHAWKEPQAAGDAGMAGFACQQALAQVLESCDDLPLRIVERMTIRAEHGPAAAA